MDLATIHSQIDNSKPVLEYAKFRTGLTYAEVYNLIFRRKWKRRNGVLGAWREIKIKMYEDYLILYKEKQTSP